MDGWIKFVNVCKLFPERTLRFACAVQLCLEHVKT